MLCKATNVVLFSIDVVDDAIFDTQQKKFVSELSFLFKDFCGDRCSFVSPVHQPIIEWDMQYVC